MNSVDPSPIDTWQDALTRRLRALVRTTPLHRIELGKGQRAIDLDRQDLRALALRVLDVTIERMGLGDGAGVEEVLEALAPLILAADSTLDHDGVREVGRVAIDAMLNERERRQAFSETYSSVSAEGVSRRELVFRLLQEVRTSDGSIVLRATAEGVNLYAGMLDYPVEDAQIAEEAVLVSQLRRGKIAEAVMTARRARLRSIEYQQKLRRILESTRRNVRAVDWVGEVLGMLDEARSHLEARLAKEHELVLAVDERLDSATAETGPELASLRDLLNECIGRHLELHTRLMDSNQTFLDQQERQVFRKRGAEPMPSLEVDVLLPAMQLTTAGLADALPFLLSRLAPVRAPTPVRLSSLVPRLLAPRREHREPALELRDAELEALAHEPRRFDEETYARVDAFLDRELGAPRPLSALLDAAEISALPRAALRLLTLRAALGFDEGDPAIEAERLPARLDAAGFRGDDLLLMRRAHGSLARS